MSEDNYWYDRYLSVCDNNNYLTAQLDASRALLAERDKLIENQQAEIEVKQRELDEYYKTSEICNNLLNENAALREEVERLKAVKTPPRIVHAQHCAVNSYSGRPNKCTCGLEG